MPRSTAGAVLDAPASGAPATPPSNGTGSTGSGGRSKRPSFLMQQLLPAAGQKRLPGALRVPIALLDPNPDQPREALKNIEELAASIEEHGLIEPISVQPPSPETGRRICIAGHRRWAAFALLAAKYPGDERFVEIDAVERDRTREEAFVLALIENLAREDLSEVEIVTSLRKLREVRDWNQSETARHLGKSRQWVSQFYRVAGDRVLSQHVQTRRLTVTKAYEILIAPDRTNRQAALNAALNGAPRAVIRQVAKSGLADGTAGGSGGRALPAPTPSGAPALDPEAAHTEGGRPRVDTAAHDGSVSAGQAPGAVHAHNGKYVASAIPDARARDLADVAEQLSLTVRFDELELTKLIRDAVLNGTDELSVSAFMRLVRADLRRLEGLVYSRRPVSSN